MPVVRTNYAPAICSERSLAMRDFQPRPSEKSTYFLRAPMSLSLANGMTKHCGAYAQVKSKAGPFGFTGLEARIDILPALKDGDSLSRRSMSRTEEDIASRVDITIM